MTTPMTHEAFNGQLMVYLDGEGDDTSRAAMERHALECAECGALLADLRMLRADAARLPELKPSHDLWSGIAARIEAPVVPISASFPAANVEVRSAGRAVRWSVAAAALVGAVGIGYLSGTARGGSLASNDTGAGLGGDSMLGVAVGTPVTNARVDGIGLDTSGDAPSIVTPPYVTPTPPAVRLAVATLSADYDREIARLRTLLEERRSQLDPVTVAIIEKNLKVIDGAIADSRKAVARDPASRFLIESLNQSLESKVELLRIAAALPNRG